MLLDQTDWDLFIEALDCRVPEWCKPRLVARNINDRVRTTHRRNYAAILMICELNLGDRQ
jgi:hypothetical protein